MRILVLGAGAVGGYFGGRMAAQGADVTFLVRENRAAQLRSGLKIESPHGDASVPVKTLTGEDVTEAFDIIILSCKSYGLAGALEAIAPYVRDGTTIVPLLNGYAHVEQLEQRFPSAIVSGGTAGIAATLTEDGTVRQMSPNQVIVVGARRGQSNAQAILEALVTDMKRGDIKATLSSDIEQAMWEKWTFLATLAASTCLMRGSVGQILATNYGEALIAGLFGECNATAAAEGYPPGTSPAQDYRGVLFDRNSTVTASMLRDLEAGKQTEADHVLGDMIARAKRHGVETPLLEAAYTHLQVYELQRRSPEIS
jgi:2-dehydropantoate 2-reductase